MAEENNLQLHVDRLLEIKKRLNEIKDSDEYVSLTDGEKTYKVSLLEEFLAAGIEEMAGKGGVLKVVTPKDKMDYDYEAIMDDLGVEDLEKYKKVVKTPKPYIKINLDKGDE